MKSISLAILLLLTTSLTASCGGGGSSSNNDNSARTPPSRMSEKRTETPFSIVFESNVGLSRTVRINGTNIGLGPAFRHERPQLNDLSTNTSRTGIWFGSGTWSDPIGRDGSATAQRILSFIKSFQRQNDRENRQSGDLITVDFGVPKTVRFGRVSQNERNLIIRAIENLNSALPYRNRLRLGSELESLLSPEDIPEGEIHIHITNGKGNWFQEFHEDENDNPDRVLGIGGALANPDSGKPRILGGYALIDRGSVRRSVPKNDLYSTQMEFVITHELLHAYGIGAHADPNQYPSSILVPELRELLRSVPPLYTSLDGESLLAIHNISPGRDISSLTIQDLGPWEKNGFQLIGSIDDPRSSSMVVEFGATFRNGLSKPWAWGPRPNHSIRNNPELSGMDTATWNGSLIGYTRRGQTTSGDATITLNLENYSGQAFFDEIETWGVSVHPGSQGAGQRWQDGDLSYIIAVPNNGASERFVSVPDQKSDLGIVSGVFTGTLHTGATGIVEHPDLSAAFGAIR
ncbi:MAG: hypothetical protein OXE56_09630 [Gammaproteobacteria bacterium]|nr:hypothetical protein [Gammaproteobacteria bacterium]